MLQSELELMGHLGGSILLGGHCGCGFLDALFLSCGGFGTVLVQQSKYARGLILTNGFGKLVDGGGDLETLVKYGALTLDADVFGPFDET